jgi:DNA-binding MarR family transcriptional regulator
MSTLDEPADEVRRYRNSRLYRCLTRTLRSYNQRLLKSLHERGFQDFSPSFPQILSNLDVEGTRIGVLAARAGVTRQAAGQLIVEIERCGYVQRRQAPDDARAVVVSFTPKGKRLLATVFSLVDEIDGEFAALLGEREFERVRAGMAKIADEVDPVGAFGAADEPDAPARARRRG